MIMPDRWRVESEIGNISKQIMAAYPPIAQYANIGHTYKYMLYMCMRVYRIS